MTNMNNPEAAGNPRDIPPQEMLEHLRLNLDAAMSNETLPQTQAPYRELELSGVMVLAGSEGRVAFYTTRMHVYEPNQVNVFTLSNSCHGVCAFAVRLPAGLEESEGKILNHSMFDGSKPFGVTKEITRRHGELSWHSIPQLPYITERDFDAAMAEHLKTIYSANQEDR